MRFEFSAGIFVYNNSDDKINYLLLIKENGDYDIPKGHIEKGENAHQAALRETKEESGLTVETKPYFSEVNKYFFYVGKKKIFKQAKFFIAESKTKSVKISHEHKGHEWVDYETAIKKIKYKNLRELMSKVNEYVKRMGAMEEVNRRYSKLPKSNDWKLSERLVPGEGRLDAKIMAIGQAPGDNEDKQRRPFIGRSGQLLNKLFKEVKLKREDIYITSVVQFFPPKNRMPSPKEIEICKPFLDEQISIVKPKYMILLGSLSSRTVADIGEVLKNHGTIKEIGGIKCLITLHPAAVLRFPENYELVLQDLKKLKAIMK